jgi:hypothetical protein
VARFHSLALRTRPPSPADTAALGSALIAAVSPNQEKLVTIIHRDHKFIYLKSRKTAGTSVEAHLITQTPLGNDIWRTAGEIAKYGLPLKRRDLLLRFGGTLVASRAFAPFHRIWMRNMRIQEHHDAMSLSRTLGSFWEQSIKAANVRNPWDLMVSAWQWRRDGWGGRAEPITAPFHEWLSAALSNDPDWQGRVRAYDPRILIHPFLFIDGRRVVDVLIRQESINDSLQELGSVLGLDLGKLSGHEKASRRDRDYRVYYSDSLAEAVQNCFDDLIRLCGYRFGAG